MIESAQGRRFDQFDFFLSSDKKVYLNLSSKTGVKTSSRLASYIVDVKNIDVQKAYCVWWGDVRTDKSAEGIQGDSRIQEAEVLMQMAFNN